MATLKNLILQSSLTLLLLFGVALSPLTQADNRTVDIYLFWAEGCPHCAREIAFVKQWAAKESQIHPHYLEITAERANRDIFATLVKHFGIEKPGVPLTVIGERYFSGFRDDTTSGAELQAAAAACIESPCRDLVQPLLAGKAQRETSKAPAETKDLPRVLNLPIFGEIALAQVSLPALTVMLAAVDGFNPCAMWTLVFLLSLLIGLRDRFRMWVLGSTFIVASAAVYYLFMAAWLNLLLFLGMLLWIRLAVGLLALGGGGYYLHEYFANPEAICKVTAADSRRRVFERLRALASERNFLLAVIGIVLLAFVVNLVELICSAGIPAVYTQVLALSHLPAWQYYAYLSLYILIFMLDDLLVFFIAMKTLQITGLTGIYVRHAHAVGGAVLIAIGLMLLFKPEWLAFSL